MRLKARSGVVALGTVLFIIFGFSSETRGSEFLLLGDEPALQSVAAKNATPSLPAGFPLAWRSRAVALNPVIASSDVLVPGDVITLNLFADTVLTAQVDRVSENINGTVTVRGRIKDYPLGYLIISTTNNNSLASIQIPETGERYRIQMNTLTGIHYLLEENTDQLDELEDGPTPIPPLPTKQEAEETRMLSETILAGPLDPVNIDVMIVYTPAAMSWAGGANGIANVIAQAMEKAQLALNNSNTVLTMTLVHSAEVSYTESGSSSTDLNRLTSTSDGYMDEVHTWRNTYKADLVALFTQVEDTGGIGWLLNSTSGDPAYGFSISRVQQAGWTYTTIHEMGHNMGCHHHKQQNFQPGPGLFSYSAGWRWVGNDSGKYCSVMTYEDGSYFPDGQTHTRVGYFSNPSILYQGVPTGDSADGDNARTLREIKGVIAAYRLPAGSLRVTLSPQEAISAGAKWRRVGTSTWFDSGYTETDVVVGSYTVEFKDTPGWAKPANLPVAINANQLTEAAGVYTIAPEVLIGTGTISWSNPLATYYHDARTQTIYLAGEIGGSYTITALALDVTGIPGTMNNFTIRLKHTNLSVYGSSPSWESSDWTTVYQTNQTITTTGWVRFNFTTPFMYNGTQNLMTDISFNNNSSLDYGFCRYSTPGGVRSIYYRTNSLYGDPLTWSNRVPTPVTSYSVPNIRLFIAPVEKVEQPVFTPDGGAYDSQQEVTITCSTPDATIHYTTNGLDPTESDLTIESGQSVLVQVEPPTTLKARAWKTNYEPSDIKTAVYRLPVIIYVKASADPNNSGANWADATSLQAALSMDPNMIDEIWVATGTYKPTNQVGGSGSRYRTFQLRNNVALYGGFAGTETLRTQRDWRINETILSGDLNDNGIDNNDAYHVFYHPQDTNLDTTAVLDGFVIIRGNANGTGDSERRGGGMYNYGSSPTIAHSIFFGNLAGVEGGAIYNDWYSSPKISNCAFISNQAEGVDAGGGGVFNSNYSSPIIMNCTLIGNSASGSGGGIANRYGDPNIKNCILWGNSAPSGSQIYNDNSSPLVGYSDVEGGYSGSGNINADPDFIRSPSMDPNSIDYGDLRLQSSSLCIDQGANVIEPNMMIDLAGEPRMIDGDCSGIVTVDMGAYEYYLVGDLNTTCQVDLNDFRLFASYWLQAGCSRPGNCGQADLDRNGTVELADLVLFSEHWLEGQ